MTIKSMTGFGRATRGISLGEISLEIRSVNSKHLDLNLRQPRFLFSLEPSINRYIRKKLARGRVDISLSLEKTAEAGAALKINEGMARAYVDAGNQLKENFQLEGGISTEFLLRLPEVIRLDDPEVEPERLWEEVRPAVDEALETLLSMRRKEGVELEKDLRSRLENIRQSVSRIDELREEVVPRIREKLNDRLKELLGDVAVDENRLAQEVALLADKADISEEVVRLESHLKQFENLLQTQESVGRRLDFQLQEMFRETNTIASKTESVEITRLTIEVKNEIEKMREQAQNVE